MSQVWVTEVEERGGHTISLWATYCSAGPGCCRCGVCLLAALAGNAAERIAGRRGRAGARLLTWRAASQSHEGAALRTLYSWSLHAAFGVLRPLTPECEYPAGVCLSLSQAFVNRHLKLRALLPSQITGIFKRHLKLCALLSCRIAGQGHAAGARGAAAQAGAEHERDGGAHGGDSEADGGSGQGQERRAGALWWRRTTLWDLGAQHLCPTNHAHRLRSHQRGRNASSTKRSHWSHAQPFTPRLAGP
eukprot:364207-Chlamydomonas_euryale.AAC.10